MQSGAIMATRNGLSTGRNRVLLVLAACTGLMLVSALPAHAQFGKRLKEAAQRAAERETTRQVEEKVARTIRCAFDDTACISAAQRDGSTVELTDHAGNALPAGASAPAPAAAGGAAAATVEAPFLNFDFVPGGRVLMHEDLSRDQVGNFPRRFQFERGNMEVAEWQGGRWLRGTSWPSVFMVPLPEVLPERFTVEMEIVPGIENQYAKVLFSERPEEHIIARYFARKVNGGVSRNSGAVSAGNSQEEIRPGTPFLLRIMVDGSYAKVYVNGTRVGNMPNASLGRENRIRIELSGSDDAPGYVRNVRVAAGGKQLYDALSETGRVATQGIYFDTGSDRIRPESAPTLREIATMLGEHADLRLAIEGHTDNVGDAAANQQLSERRAAAVKAYLEKEHQVAASRLEANGLGASKPTAPNDSPEGRQQNRRVELVRL
jgi:OmpA-OmpF porin, OOP family